MVEIKIMALTQMQIIQSLGEAMNWFEREISWEVPPTELRHLCGRIGELYAALITNGQMATEVNQKGYDVVSGWRIKRQDTFVTRTFPSRMANGLISWVTGVKLHDYGCTLKAYRREVLTGFRLYGEMHRFIPAYAGYVGAKILEVPVRHHPRRFGKTKYGLERTLKVVLDLFTVKFLISYSHKPLYLFGGAGMGLMSLSILTLIFLMIRRLAQGVSVFLSPLFPTALMFMVMGFQSILMGFIAELLVRTYHEAQSKPTYTLRRIIGGPRETE